MGFASDTTNKYTDLLAKSLPNRFSRGTTDEIACPVRCVSAVV